MIKIKKIRAEYTDLFLKKRTPNQAQMSTSPVFRE
jgi:hypothetical protein